VTARDNGVLGVANVAAAADPPSMENERLLTCSEVARAAPRRVSSQSVWRWCRYGLIARDGTRVRLEHLRQGGRVLVPESALHPFFRALAEADARYFDAAAHRRAGAQAETVKV